MPAGAGEGAVSPCGCAEAMMSPRPVSANPEAATSLLHGACLLGRMGAAGTESSGWTEVTLAEMTSPGSMGRRLCAEGSCSGWAAEGCFCSSTHEHGPWDTMTPRGSFATVPSTLLPHFIQHVCPQRVSLHRAISMTAPDNLWHIKLFGDKMETSGRTQISLSRLSVSTRHCR